MAEKVVIGNAELWHADCREVLPQIAAVADLRKQVETEAYFSRATSLGGFLPKLARKAP